MFSNSLEDAKTGEKINTPEKKNETLNAKRMPYCEKSQKEALSNSKQRSSELELFLAYELSEEGANL